jgi:hypothetical protein
MNSVVFIFFTCWFSGVYKITIIIFIPNISSKKCELANIDEIVKSHFTAWIPAYAGMTAIVSARY